MEPIGDHWVLTVIAGLATFLLGRFWEASSRIFLMRQEAYSAFLAECATLYEFLMRESDEDYWKLFSSLRRGASNLGLYSSPRVDSLAGQYLGMISKIVRMDPKKDLGAYQAKISELENFYAELNEAMRRDALGWTYYGFMDRLTRKKQSHTAWRKQK